MTFPVTRFDQLLKECRDKAYYAFGSSKIFERRMRRLEISRNGITYLGIAVPLLVGSIALMSVGKNLLPYLEIPAGACITAQLALSLWSVIAKWDDKYSYAIVAMQAQTRLFNSWEDLARNQPADLEQKVRELAAEDQRQESSDLAQNISDKEKRFAMRKTLYHFGLPCQGCKLTPSSMIPTNCDTCGNFGGILIWIRKSLWF